MFFDEKIDRIGLSDEENKNYLLLSDGERLLIELDERVKGGKGKNACVYRARHPEGGKDVIVKLCRFPLNYGTEEMELKRKRFKREINAFKLAQQKGYDKCLIAFFEDGVTQIGHREFMYYAMEEADGDLADYLIETELSLQQKLHLCESILGDIQGLHALGIYHRDLKPDNIFIVDEMWKIGDLGFIAYRHEDEIVDELRERIGPTGLMSPEATNKAFGITEGNEFDCCIDESSDVYLLGGVFWFIMQGNLPTGQLQHEDFRVNHRRLYESVLIPMLQHAKKRRANLLQIAKDVAVLGREIGL